MRLYLWSFIVAWRVHSVVGSWWLLGILVNKGSLGIVDGPASVDVGCIGIEDDIFVVGVIVAIGI